MSKSPSPFLTDRLFVRINRISESKPKEATNPSNRRRAAKGLKDQRGRELTMGQCACFGAAQAAKEQRAEADRLEAQEARGRAAEAAQKR
jgi:hypothetical protein